MMTARRHQAVTNRRPSPTTRIRSMPTFVVGAGGPSGRGPLPGTVGGR